MQSDLKNSWPSVNLAVPEAVLCRAWGRSLPYLRFSAVPEAVLCRTCGRSLPYLRPFSAIPAAVLCHTWGRSLPYLRSFSTVPEVVFGVGLVHEQPEQVETGEQRGRQLDVGLHGAARVVAPIGRVSRSQDRDARVQRAHDASLETKGVDDDRLSQRTSFNYSRQAYVSAERRVRSAVAFVPDLWPTNCR